MKILIICLGLFSFSVIAKPNFSALDEYLQTLHDNNKLMFSVTVNQQGKVLYEKHLGVVSQLPKLGIDAHTQFRVGSVTKTFTATLIMQLVEAGKLTLDTTLSAFFKDIKLADKITISHLLSHRSGIANFTERSDFVNYMYFPQSTERMLQIISEMDTLFEPGSQHKYSNSNYLLLGFIIEQVTQKSYAKVLQQNIVEPLSLQRTEYGQAIDVARNQARSFAYNGYWQTVPESNMSVPHGAGAVISTSNELNQFIEGLFSGKLLSKTAVNQMTTLNDNYGFGLYAFPYNEKRFIGHNGRIDGFLSVMAIQPEDNIAISLLANGVNYPFDNALVAILDSIYGKSITQPNFSQQPRTYKMSELEELAGKYTSSTVPLDINLFIKNGQLHAQATNQRALKLASYANFEFGFASAGIVIRFIDAEESTKQFVLEQGGGRHTFVKE